MKKVIKRIVIILIALLLILGAYGTYVLTSYYRLPDNLTLEVKRNGANFYFEDAQPYTTGKFYWAMTYNTGFGAYQKDFSFFMDGGKSSWAEDEDSVIASVCGMGEIINNVNPDFVFLQEKVHKLCKHNSAESIEYKCYKTKTHNKKGFHTEEFVCSHF